MTVSSFSTKVVRDSSALWRWAFGLGLVTNTLALAQTWYMLEVYDRVVGSRNSQTLLMLTVLVFILYVTLEWVELIRHSALGKLADWLDYVLAPTLFSAKIKGEITNQDEQAPASLGDLQVIKNFLNSPLPLAMLDTPFALIALAALLAIDPLLALTSLCLVTVQALAGWYGQRGAAEPLAQANQFNYMASRYANNANQAVTTAFAMGYTRRQHDAWLDLHAKTMTEQNRASYHAGAWTSVAKWVQVMQQSLLLGLGSYLTLTGSLDPSGLYIIVGSILGGRVLSPFAQIIPQWRQWLSAKECWQRVDRFMTREQSAATSVQLPAPIGRLDLAGVGFGASKADTSQRPPVLRGISFQLQPGDSLCIVGPSGSGKTTLGKLLVGVFKPSQGSVRLDGADINTWNKDDLGPYIGYVPPEVELLDGTIAQNICRFSEQDSESLNEVVAVVELNEMMSRMPQGIETMVGQDGVTLSGGMQQRVALARALYRWPKLLVLDEPNAHLDEEGNLILLRALKIAQKKGCTVITISHRKDVVKASTHLLALKGGQAHVFGRTKEILARSQERSPVATERDGE